MESGTYEIIRNRLVSAGNELRSRLGQLNEARRELAGEGVDFGEPSLGMMVEVPSAAIAVDEFDADFYSIGSNDLVQYVPAAGRDAAWARDDRTPPVGLRGLDRCRLVLRPAGCRSG